MPAQDDGLRGNDCVRLPECEPTKPSAIAERTIAAENLKEPSLDEFAEIGIGHATETLADPGASSTSC